jgi:cytochrome P450
MSTVASRTIRAGDNIGLIIVAANRDARWWPDGDQLRLDRADPRPLSFGHAHHCLGAALARMELRLAIPPLLRHLGDDEVDLDGTTWKRSFALRGPLSLPVRVGAGTARPTCH